MSNAQQVFSGPRPIVKMLTHVMKPALRRRSLGEATIILDWVKIIGAELAQRCYPERLIFPRGKREGGTLMIAVDSGSSLLIQYSESLLIDWINSYFGYQAIARIKLKHTQIPFKTTGNGTNHEKTCEMTEVEEAQAFLNMKDSELKNAMIRFKSSYDARMKSKET
ncbi:MAG: DUF721 domain-containing protein [Caedimonas sp.]|nr:DUF721 domain-containing protein [Caedimonas sp.]